MRWILALLTIALVALIAIGSVLLRDYPFKIYKSWASGLNYNRYYNIKKYNSKLLKPNGVLEIEKLTEDYVQLWKEFPIRNCLIPLPTRHPLFQTIPIIELKNKSVPPQLGMIILSSNLREISRVFTLPNSLYEDQSLGQELFKLPIVRSEIIKHPIEKVWTDVFKHEIEIKKKPFEEMIYDLYILHLRSKILSEKMIHYGLLNNNKAIVELESENKDYRLEHVFTFDKGNIYSYVLRTEIRNPDSTKLRSKFLENISLNSIDPAMGKILYTEFKQMNFARQVDQEGMLYLFSAWSQDIENQELLKEMIYFLERGRGERPQLEVLYKYAFDKYGKTFTTRKDFNEKGDQNIVLQRKIEIENIEKRKQAEEMSKLPPPPNELTPEERMNMYLKKAKSQNDKNESKKEMTVH